MWLHMCRPKPPEALKASYEPMIFLSEGGSTGDRHNRDRPHIFQHNAGSSSVKALQMSGK